MSVTGLRPKCGIVSCTGCRHAPPASSVVIAEHDALRARVSDLERQLAEAQAGAGAKLSRLRDLYRDAEQSGEWVPMDIRERLLSVIEGLSAGRELLERVRALEDVASKAREFREANRAVKEEFAVGCYSGPAVDVQQEKVAALWRALARLDALAEKDKERTS